MLRRAIFQVHLWSGLALGLYFLLIGGTGFLLMFRPELQAWTYPELFPPGRLLTDDAFASPDIVAAELRARFPDAHFSGIDYPSYRRGTFLVYLTKGDDFRAVFLDATTGRFIGALPKTGWIQQLQTLHFELWAGRTGRMVNGAGGLGLLLMTLTGAVIAWPRRPPWRRMFVVHSDRGWRRVTWELHRAVGAWSLALLVMWAVTGFHFAFPRPLRTLVTAVLPPGSTPAQPRATSGELGEAPALLTLVSRAQQAYPSAAPARVLVPSTADGDYAVTLARARHGDWDSSDEVTLRFDLAGAFVGESDAARRPVSERIIAWLGIAHVGIFGGWPVKLLWALGGLALPVLFTSGFVMWWNRVVVRARVQSPRPTG